MNPPWQALGAIGGALAVMVPAALAAAGAEAKAIALDRDRSLHEQLKLWKVKRTHVVEVAHSRDRFGHVDGIVSPD